MKATITDIFLKSIKRYLIKEMASDLKKFTHSKQLIKEINNCLNFFFVDMCFSGLEKRKAISYQLPDMIEHWLAVTGIGEYLQRNHHDQWGSIIYVIETNLTGAFLNAHYDYQHQET
ncbi:MAG: hypothetical protein EBW49_05220 [Betaproteobacteria bacterium]|jgi:hypothetical protein|nr:hypothetical protein [Betaproteobacteria bacterium]NCX39628.1 hypothetical protein [Actinomycetota bacterium]NDG16220.1 hypothetical protein [Betaproteobacteria bacterium]